VKKIITITLILFGSLSACKERVIKFNKIGWSEFEDGLPILREKMIDDLLKNHVLKGLSYKQLVDTVGTPNEQSILGFDSVSYIILLDYGHDIDPVHTKTLRFYFDKDSIITNWKIIEQKK